MHVMIPHKAVIQNHKDIFAWQQLVMWHYQQQYRGIQKTS